jgi:hypothetical protein
MTKALLQGDGNAPVNHVKELYNDFEYPSELGCGGQMTLQGVLLPIIAGRLYLTCTTSSAVMQPQKRELWLAFNEFLVFHHTDTHIYLLSLALALSIHTVGSKTVEKIII